MAVNTKNLANGMVATAPSPATTGTTLVLQSGYGATMPAVPFFLTLTPPGQLSTMGNSEVVLVTAVSTDTLTIVRAKKNTSAKAIDVGWVASNGIYTETTAQVGDIMMTLNSVPRAGRLFMAGGTYNKSDYPLMYQYVVDNANYGTTTSTTFTLRDMSSRVPVGKAASGTFASLAATGGTETETLTLAQVPAHDHVSAGGLGITYIGAGGEINLAGGTTWTPSDRASLASNIRNQRTNSQGGGGSHNNLQPYIVVNYEVIAE